MITDILQTLLHVRLSKILFTWRKGTDQCSFQSNKTVYGGTELRVQNYTTCKWDRLRKQKRRSWFNGFSMSTYLYSILQCQNVY